MSFFSFGKMMGPAAYGGLSYPLANLASFIADFAGNKFYSRNADLSGPLTEISNPFTTTSSGGTYTNSFGVLTAATSNTLRRTYDPVTLSPQGIIVEEQRTNLFLNSKLDGTNLSTQAITLTSGQTYTVSFYGTGSIALSGASSATMNGSGAYPTRTTLTFVAGSTSLTATVSGTVQYAQAELGAFVTSFIPTAGSAVTRTADVTDRNLGAEYSANSNTLVLSGITAPSFPAEQIPLNIDDGGSSNSITFRSPSGNAGFTLRVQSGGANQCSLNTGALTASTKVTIGGVVSLNDFRASKNGGTVLSDTSGVIPVGVVKMRFYSPGPTFFWNGIIGLVEIFPSAVSNADLQTLSAQ